MGSRAQRGPRVPKEHTIFRKGKVGARQGWKKAIPKELQADGEKEAQLPDDVSQGKGQLPTVMATRFKFS